MSEDRNSPYAVVKETFGVLRIRGPRCQYAWESASFKDDGFIAESVANMTNRAFQAGMEEQKRRTREVLGII